MTLHTCSEFCFKCGKDKADCKNCGQPIQWEPTARNEGWVHVRGCIITKHCVDLRKGMRRAPLETVAEPNVAESALLERQEGNDARS